MGKGRKIVNKHRGEKEVFLLGVFQKKKKQERKVEKFCKSQNICYTKTKKKIARLLRNVLQKKSAHYHN